MKARDIIPGWPKGRTTVSGDRWLNYPPWWRNWSEEEFENIRYHQQQAAMAKGFIEQGKPLSMLHAFGVESLSMTQWNRIWRNASSLR